MILLSPTDTPKFRKAVRKHPNHFGWFLTPRKRGIPRTLKAGHGKFGTDTDCFNKAFDLSRYIQWLHKLQPWSHRSLFAPCPDVVGDWTATLDKFWWSQPIIASTGHPVAIVLQDGATAETVPWHLINAVFLGGHPDTGWKMSQDALTLLQEARQRGKWCHVGRVNSQKRISHFWGVAHSSDGTFIAKSPDKALRRLGSHVLALAKQRPMPI